MIVSLSNGVQRMAFILSILWGDGEKGLVV